jgi:hypothetical protein
MKCQFCGYEAPNIRDDEGKDTGQQELWPSDRCPRSILPAPAACGIPLEEGAIEMLTDPELMNRDDLMEHVRTPGPHISAPKPNPNIGTSAPKPKVLESKT